MGSSPAYPSDLTDAQWALIEPLVPVGSTRGKGTRGGRPPTGVPPPPHRGRDLVPGSDRLLGAGELAAPLLRQCLARDAVARHLDRRRAMMLSAGPVGTTGERHSCRTR